MPNQVRALELTEWLPEADPERTRRAVSILESGKVLHLSSLVFRLRPEEQRFLDPRWSDGRAKNISYDPATGTLKGAQGNRADLEELQALIVRFHRQATALVERLLPDYAPQLREARTSLRPSPVRGRRTSWREDDSRLHVDAFPSRPNHGERILRVFANVNPHGVPRVWRVGEPFPDVAAHFWPRLKAPLPGSSAMLAALRVTRSRRSRYDHYMLALHDAMKADIDYQRNAPQETARFAPGCVWLCFSDQTSHAAMSGQHLFEQTLHLPLAGLRDPRQAPLRILEGLAGRPLA